MTRDILFRNAPLIEVIVEVHWKLQRISIPGGGIDPHFEVFTEDSRQRLKAGGFLVEERLPPPDFPLEMLAHQPVFRYRQQAGRWPLVQTGPGILTVNIVPPYGGWDNFRPIIENALEVLYGAYPLPERYLKIERLDLRYINGFSARHGFDNFSSFTAKNTTLSMPLPDALKETCEDTSGVSYSFEIRTPLRTPPSSHGLLKYAPGTAKGEPASILELHVRAGEDGATPQTASGIAAWMDEAHLVTRSWFQGLLTEPGRTAIGPMEEIGGQDAS